MVYIVFGWFQYYPDPNNVQGVFNNIEDAEEFRESIRGKFEDTSINSYKVKFNNTLCETEE